MQSSVTDKGTATAGLAAFASQLTYADNPAEVVQKAKLCVLDTIGCCVYGVKLGPVGKLLSMVLAEEARPAAQILGTGHRTSPANAALVNATAAHAFQLDELHTGSTLHPGTTI